MSPKCDINPHWENSWGWLILEISIREISTFSFIFHYQINSFKYMKRTYRAYFCIFSDLPVLFHVCFYPTLSPLVNFQMDYMLVWNQFSFCLTDCLTKAKEPIWTYHLSWDGKKNRWIHAFPTGISTKSNANSLIQGFELEALILFPMTMEMWQIKQKVQGSDYRFLVILIKIFVHLSFCFKLSVLD